MNGSAKTVRVEGVRVAYEEAGAGEPLLLLHGYPQSRFAWRKLLPGLARRRRAIAPDWFGWGESEKNLALGYGYEEEVRRLGALADALGLGRFDLFGHDYGGYLAFGFAVRFPERVRRLALLNTRAHRTFPPASYAMFRTVEVLARTPALRPLALRIPWAALHRRSLARYARLGCFDDALLGRYVDWMSEPEGKRWFLRFWQGYETAIRPDLAEAARGVRCPAALVWATRDPYFPLSIAEDLAARIPDATLTRIEGADHYVLEERPEEVLAALEALLARPAA